MKWWEPKGNPMCKDCGFWLMCDNCSRFMDKADIELRRRGL